MNNATSLRLLPRGQAMTEFTVTAMFLLVPIFLLIPIVGKYIDLRQSTVQTARNMAWERSVWFEQANWPEEAGKAQFRTEKQIESETMRRNLAAASAPITSSQWAGNLTDSEINPLWHDHAGNALLSAVKVRGGVDLQPQRATSNDAASYRVVETLGDFEDLLNSGITEVNNAVSSITSTIGVNPPSVGKIGVFSKINTHGLYSPTARIPVNNIPSLARFGSSGVAPLANINLIMHGDAALLVDNWAAKDDKQFEEWVNDITITHIFKPFFDPVQSALNSVQIPVINARLAPRTAPGILRFGEANTGTVKPSNVTPDCPGGLCSYE